MTLKQQVVFLEGEQVNLRPLDKRADLKACHRWINDPEVRRRIENVWPMTLQDEEAWFDRQTGERNLVLAIVRKKDPQIIGVMSLHDIRWRDRRAASGALIGDKANRGKGFGKDAKQALLRFAFHTLGLQKVCSMAFADNEASIRYNKACGYREDGRLRQHFFRDGKWHDAVVLSVLRSDWEKLQSPST